MSDEQFDAFLRGEDDLSRRLQGLTQPASSPKLDAAILGYVKAGLEQEARAAQAARPAAANDAVIEGAPPRLAPGLGRRWRIPAGIAAGVLAGVLGHQVYQGSGGGAGMEGGMAAAPTAEAPQVVANVTLDMERPAPPVAMDVPAPSAPAPASVEASAAPAPTPVMKAAPPSPAPVQVAAAPPSQELQRVEITGSSIKRTAAESTLPVEALKQKDSKQPYQGYNSDNPVPEVQSPPPVALARAPEPVAAPAPAPVRVAAAPPAEPVADDARAAAAAPAARPARVAGRESKSDLELSKARAFDAHDKRAHDWLAVIDAMLKAKLDKDALAEWARFRAAYPDYPVPAATRDRIAAIKQ
ncbi:hypothetical protein [Massilia sp. CCM 8734]|uniref:hypothetical protein n=1 Tax=Massilia sp. CCM 8734 TaxID=2609283 RepID=UPI00141F4643|nr:hypothetical protein [Massilia sp. CCM 8734]NHZ94407.1 hypothetical protein [Massilia sp. CCM 8734]